MAGQSARFGPVALTTTYTTNIFNPPTLAGGVNASMFTKTKATIRHMKVTNKGATAATFRLYVGATGANAAGTEHAYDVPVAAGSYVDLWGPICVLTTHFIVGGASALTTLTITGAYDLEVSP